LKFIFKEKVNENGNTVPSLVSSVLPVEKPKDVITTDMKTSNVPLVQSNSTESEKFLDINQNESESDKEDDETNENDDKDEEKSPSNAENLIKKMVRNVESYNGLTPLVNYVLPHTFRSFENARSKK
jgi:hypothetical protein